MNAMEQIENEYSGPRDPATRQAQIDGLMMKLLDPGANNEPMLGVNIIAMQRAQAGGYPKHMYHKTLPMRIAINKGQEQMLLEHDYRDKWVNQEYPRYYFRRNLDPKFEAEGFIESRLVKNRLAEQALIKPGSGWFDSPEKLAALSEESSEDAALKIARLEGELAEARRRNEGRNELKK